MKTYFVFKDNGNIFMVDVISKEKNPDIAIMDIDKNVRFFMDIKFGTFVEAIRLYRIDNSKIKVEYCVESLPEGGFIVKKLRSDDKDSKYSIEYSRTHMYIQMTEKNEKHFLEFEDDDSARLWVEAMRNEYPERRSW